VEIPSRGQELVNSRFLNEQRELDEIPKQGSRSKYLQVEVLNFQLRKL